jgi:hypothetical protein
MRKMEAEMHFLIVVIGYITTDYKCNENIREYLGIIGIKKIIINHQKKWLEHSTRISGSEVSKD